jgi:hypothetical protein
LRTFAVFIRWGWKIIGGRTVVTANSIAIRLQNGIASGHQSAKFLGNEKNICCAVCGSFARRRAIFEAWGGMGYFIMPTKSKALNWLSADRAIAI